MQTMMLRMLSTGSLSGSLSAFAAGAAQAGFGQSRAIHRVRAVGSQAQPGSQPAPSPAGTQLAPGASPGRILPRGSLLDLSV
jgi:hypothetical protein